MFDRRRFMSALSSIPVLGPVLDAVAEQLLRIYSPDQVRDATARRSIQAPDSLHDWARHFLKPILTCELSPFHRWLARELDTIRTSRNARLNILAPRGSAKSSWASYAYPLREALEEREPFIVIVSDTSAQAETFLRQIRAQLEENEEIRRVYPRAFGKGPVWRDSHIQLRNGCEILAMGTGGKIRGRKSVANRRATLILADDLQNKDHILSRLQRERSWEWFTKDLMSAGEPGTNIVVLGTALHREGISCRLEEGEASSGWKSSKWRALRSWPDNMDLWQVWQGHLHNYDVSEEQRLADALAFFEVNRDAMLTGAEALWPEREPVYDLLLHRATIGHAAFEAEKQNNPINPDSCEWPQEYLNFPGMWFDEWPALDQMTIRTLGVDPSKGKRDALGDYSAVVLFGRDKRGIEYIEAFQFRRPVEQLCAEIVRLSEIFTPHGIALETNQFQELILLPLRDAARRAGVTEPLKTYHFDHYAESKESRIRTLTHPLAQRRFRFKSRSPGTMLLVQQMRDWPGGDHDDGVDSLQTARQLAVELSNSKAVKRQVSAV